MDRNRNALPVWAKVATSLSARRAWIEIAHSLNHKVCVRVALRKESVDRNVAIAAAHFYGKVALRKESVDRNHSARWPSMLIKVALRKESVDRNKFSPSL